MKRLLPILFMLLMAGPSWAQRFQAPDQKTVPQNRQMECTDYPRPGVWQPQWTAGHSYCLGHQAERGVYIIPTAQTISANNITIACSNPSIIIKFIATSGVMFTASADNLRIIGCALDGNSTAGLQAILANTSTTNLYVSDVTLQNWGTNSSNGTIQATGGSHLRFDHLQNNNSGIADSIIYFQGSSGSVTDASVTNSSFVCTSSSAPCLVSGNNVGPNNFAINISHNVIRSAGGSCIKFAFNSFTTESTVGYNSCTLTATSGNYAYHFDDIRQTIIIGNVYDINGQVGTGGMFLSHCQSSQAIGNTFVTGFDSFAIHSIDGDGCKIIGNDIVVPCANGGAAGIGIWIDEDSVSNYNPVIADNIIRFPASGTCSMSSTSAAIQILSTTGNHIDNGVIVGNVIENGVLGSTAGLAAAATISGIALGTSGTSSTNNWVIEGNRIDMPAKGSGTSSTAITVGTNAADTQINTNRITVGASGALIADSGTRSRIFTHEVATTGTLSSGTLTVTLTNADVFTSSTSYKCVANDTTAANPVKISNTSGTAFVLTGTTSDVIGYDCKGY